MIRALRKLKNKPVNVTFTNKPTMGGGVESGEPEMVLLFLDTDSVWTAFQWEWSGEDVMVPTGSILCIGADLKGA